MMNDRRVVERRHGEEQQMTRSSWSRKVCSPTVIVAAIFLVVATCSSCGSSSKKAAATTGTTAGSTGGTATGAAGVSGCPSAPGVTPTQVKVGVSWDETGALASNSAFGPAVRARIAVANKSGGINGRQIVEADADAQSDPGKALAAAQGLVQSNGVFALIDGNSISPPTYAYAAQSGVPFFANLGGGPQFATAKNLFSAGGAWTAGSGTGLTNATFLQEHSVKTVATFAHPSVASIDAAHAWNASAEKVGIKVLYENEAIPYQSFDATSIALRVKQLKPDAMVFALSLPASISIIRALAQQGYTVKVSLMSTAYDPTVTSAGVAGSYAVTGFVPYLGTISTLPEPAQAFRSAMATYSPQTGLTAYAIGGWAAASLFLDALQLAGKCPTRAGMVSAMRAVKSYNPGGVLPEAIQFSPGVTPDGNPQSCYFYVQILSTSLSVPTAPVCT